MKLRDEAYHGIIGDIVKAIEPHSEADPASILMHLIVYIGNIVGRGPHFTVEATKHYTNLFTMCVGTTASGRKGTSLGYIHEMLKQIDPDYMSKCVVSGLSSGEGVIHSVRDPEELSMKRKGVPDPGVEDKRLLVLESEFALALKTMKRESNTLSAVLRSAWDGSPLGTLTKNSKERCEEPHISLIGHITPEELAHLLSANDVFNGFGNRFLFAKVERSKSIPLGGTFHGSEEFNDLTAALKEKIEVAKGIGEVNLTEGAIEHWNVLYESLSNGYPGVVGKLAGRAAPQVRRIALIYAIMDGENEVKIEHIIAAQSIWMYCLESLIDIFGDSFGNRVADTLRPELDDRPSGMNRTEIQKFFNNNTSKAEIDVGLNLLKDAGMARMTKHATSGRPSETWFSTKYDNYDINEEADHGEADVP